HDAGSLVTVILSASDSPGRWRAILRLPRGRIGSQYAAKPSLEWDSEELLIENRSHFSASCSGELTVDA
ncbi:hypothetical protein, partial [Rhizobium johnstonii]|uniref:hypothetical protein n=1 Tax=Rhizobium johnstonii TaxID=3019933 RepID=UPI003F9A5BF3